MYYISRFRLFKKETRLIRIIHFRATKKKNNWYRPLQLNNYYLIAYLQDPIYYRVSDGGGEKICPRTSYQ